MFGAAARLPPAAPTTLVVRTKGPVTVHLGVVPHHINDVDLKRGIANIDFYIWTRWQGEVDGAAFEVMNGVLEAKDHEFKEQVDGFKYAYYRCRANVKGRFDFRDYPLDRHELILEIMHSAEEEGVLVWGVDEAALREVEAPKAAGRVVDRPRFEIGRTVYRTNWGHPKLAQDKETVYSRFLMTVPIRHAGSTTFLKSFLALFISILIAGLAYATHPEKFDGRIGVGVAGIFGVVSSQLLVGDRLPEVHYLTLSGLVHILALGYVFLSIAMSCVSERLLRKGREALAVRIDRIVGLAATGAFAALVAALTILR